MKPLPHIYKAQLSGGAEGYAVVSVARIPEFRTAPPADFDGLGDVWSPNQFLMAAVETCFLFTLQAVARASKLPSGPWSSRTSEAHGLCPHLREAASAAEARSP